MSIGAFKYWLRTNGFHLINSVQVRSGIQSK